MLALFLDSLDATCLKKQLIDLNAFLEKPLGYKLLFQASPLRYRVCSETKRADHRSRSCWVGKHWAPWLSFGGGVAEVFL